MTSHTIAMKETEKKGDAPIRRVAKMMVDAMEARTKEKKKERAVTLLTDEN